MKVLFTTNIPVPYRVEFFNLLGKLVDLTVLFERNDAKTRDTGWLAAEYTNFTPVFLDGGVKFGDDLRISPSIYGFVRQNKFDKVVIGIYYSPTGMFLSEYYRHKNVDLYFTYDGGFVKHQPWWKLKVKQFMMRGAKYYISPSEECDKVLRQYGVNKQQCKRYPFTSLSENDVAAAPAKQEELLELRKELGIEGNFVIITVGRMVYFKRWDLLANVIPMMPKDTSLYIVGGSPVGTYYEPCQSIVNVHFIDFKNKDTLKKYYRAADVFAIPSTDEVWGLVVNEAMAQGLPVISAKTCGAALELVENGVNGAIYDTYDSEALITCLSRFYNNQELRERIGNNNIEKIRNYTIEEMAKAYYNILIQ